MKAAVYIEYGPPDRLATTGVPKPSPDAGELLARIQATTANPTDLGFLRGIPRIVRLFSGLRAPKHTILGNEFTVQFETGEFRPVIDRQYPLDEIVDAFRYVESGRKTGNVVITVDHNETGEPAVQA